MGNLLCNGQDIRRAQRRTAYFERNGSLRKSNKFVSQSEFLKLVRAAGGGEQVFVCSYSRWVQKLYRVLCFNVNTDYISARPSYQRIGTIARPDLQNGRNFQVEHYSRKYIRIREGKYSLRVEIPEMFPDGSPGNYVYGTERSESDITSDFYHFTELILEGSPFYYGIARMIGYRAGICVVQCCDIRNSHASRILIVHLNRKTCLAMISVEPISANTQQNINNNNHTPPIFQEAYISKDARQILIRPDDVVTRSSPHIFNVGPPRIIKHEENDSSEIFLVENFPGAITFDNRHPSQYLFQAYQDTLYLVDLNSQDIDLEVVKSEQLANLDADVVQIKSSHSGQYLALRCVSPTRVGEFRPCLLNFIYILAADSFQTLFCCDARGPYWPVSETINYQVFPCFSACDTLVSFMKNSSSKRKVFVYKLPVTTISLQHSCRSVILRQIGSFSNVNRLNLPNQIKLFLQYKL